MSRQSTTAVVAIANRLRVGPSASLPYHSHRHDISSLKVIATAGGAVSSEVFDFICRKVKIGVAYSNIYACSELGAAALCDLTVEAYEGEISVPCLALDVQCVNTKAEPVEGEYGEMILANPSPAMMIGIWGDSDGSKTKEIYYSKYPGNFYFGDCAIVNPTTKGFIICGRSVDTLNLQNMRYSSSQLYDAVAKLPEVQDSICVSQSNKNMEEREVLFLKMKEGHKFDEALVKRVQDTIGNELSDFYIPSVILETNDIPYDAIGEKLELVVENIINNRPYDIESVANPDSLQNYYNNPQLNDKF